MSDLTNENVIRLRRVLEEPDLVGTRYRVIREVARGGMGRIWEVEDTELNRRVALKVQPPWEKASASLLQCESRILATLEHPGIVPVHDAGVLRDGRVFYMMKLVQGRRLDEAVATMSRSERLRLFQRICEPVAFAHARGVIHRDLKPENVMIGEFGEVLVMDWGVAKLAGADAEQGVIGTPGCMAPEQARGENDRVDERSDVYGLGGVLEFLLAWPRTPKALDAICRKALAADPGSRYATVAEMSADIGRFLEGAPVGAYPENLVEMAARWTGRHQTLVLLLLTYVILRALLLLFLRR